VIHMTMTATQARTFRRTLATFGFVLVRHPFDGTRLDGPGVSVVLVPDFDNRRIVDVHVHWRRHRINRTSERLIDRAEARAFLGGAR